MSSIKFEFILTYCDRDQDLLYIEFDKNIGEEDFVRKILENLDNDVRSLIKISSMPLNCEFEDIPSYLHHRQGKYYFNTDVNKDDDTKKWYEFKNNFIKTKK
jgi:hypothetical protein